MAKRVEFVSICESVPRTPIFHLIQIEAIQVTGGYEREMEARRRTEDGGRHHADRRCQAQPFQGPYSQITSLSGRKSAKGRINTN